MESYSIELNNEWVQALTDQVGVILPPTKATHEKEGYQVAIDSVLMCVGTPTDENDENVVLMPKEAISFETPHNVWIKAKHGKPWLGVIK